MSASSLSEQNVHFARLISDRAVVIERGRGRLAGTVAEIDADACAACPSV